MKDFLIDLFLQSVRLAHPSVCLAAYLQGHFPKPENKGKLFILACGKASGAVAAELDHFFSLPQNSSLRPEQINIVTRHGFSQRFDGMNIQEAGHPFPDEASVYAAEEALKIAGQAGKDDIVWVILSGGASALWCAPVEGLGLSQKQELTRNLLRSGADIDKINCVRKHFSRIKGGGLAQVAFPARVITTAISDVVGDDWGVIGSGVTSPDPTSLEDAQNILKHYHVEVPENLANYLKDTDHETLKKEDSIFSDRAKIDDVILACGQTLLDEAERRLIEEGYKVFNWGDRLIGEARDVALAHGQKIKDYIQAGHEKFAVLSGGELTVTVTGSGKGGSNQEYALALAMALEGEKHLAALSVDSDGIDGGDGGALDPAGAYSDSSTLCRASALELSPATFLKENDSGGFFQKLDDLVITGSTQTNVNDFRVVVFDKNK